MATCRFCKRWEASVEMVTYSTRHHAHFECYLNAGKPLTALSDWQIGRFPYRLLKAAGLLDIAEAASDREHARVAALPR